MTRSLLISGALARRPGAGGHAWALLQYALGFRRLGWEVTFLDRVDGVADRDSCLRWADAVMRAAGLDGDHAIFGEGGESVAGLSRAAVLGRARRSAALLNVMGYLVDEELRSACSLRVFLDIDPGYGQMWRELELADIFDGHEAYVTVGAAVGHEDCTVPTCGLRWLTTAPPVVLGQWPSCPGGTAFTSVATWRGPYGPVSYGGKTYGSRAHEFRRFATLPSCAGADCELALDIDSADETDRAALIAGGWRLVDPVAAAGDPGSYRRYVQSSGAEICVAQGMYVRSRGGWFSDRSACYLASGKPVVAQETGFTKAYSAGRGLLAFATLDEAVAAVQEVARDPRRHASAARKLAEEHFDSDRVLGRLCDELGLP